MSRLNWIGRRAIRPGSWLARMLERKPKMLVAIALANKMARAVWAMIVKGEDYTNGPFGWLEGDSQSSRALAQCGLKGWRQAWQG